MSDTEQKPLPPSLTEAETAARYKARAATFLAELAALAAEAEKDGLLIRWDGLGRDALGKPVFCGLRVEKHY